MTLHEYLQGMKGKTAAVIGLGVSNRPLVELLARNGVKVIACDRKERAALGGAAAHYEALGAVLHLGEGYLRDLDADVVFRTPGMRPDVPELLEAKAHGAVITSEMEAFFAVCPCPILGVTGSDGKTTTASVIAELLKAEGRRVWLGGNIGRPLLADAEQMKRVINNIIGNSLKYLDKKKGILNIRIKDDGDFIQVIIEDNGKGIAAKDLPYIFDRFYRTDTSRNSSKGGSGIGLSIVRKIIEDHGGKIWANSKLGCGTVMYFVLRKYQEVPVNEQNTNHRR